MQNAVRINIKRDLNLRNATRCWWNAIQAEVAERLVITRHRAFALQNMDVHRGLAVCCRAEDFSLLGRDRGVARNLHRHHTT